MLTSCGWDLRGQDRSDEVALAPGVGLAIMAKRLREMLFEVGVGARCLRRGSKGIAKTKLVRLPNRSDFADMHVHRSRFAGWWTEEAVARFAHAQDQTQGLQSRPVSRFVREVGDGDLDVEDRFRWQAGNGGGTDVFQTNIRIADGRSYAIQPAGCLGGPLRRRGNDHGRLAARSIEPLDGVSFHRSIVVMAAGLSRATAARNRPFRTANGVGSTGPGGLSDCRPNAPTLKPPTVDA